MLNEKMRNRNWRILRVHNLFSQINFDLLSVLRITGNPAICPPEQRFNENLFFHFNMRRRLSRFQSEYSVKQTKVI